MSHHAEIFSVLNTGNIGPSFDLLIGSISSYYLIQTLMLSRFSEIEQKCLVCIEPLHIPANGVSRQILRDDAGLRGMKRQGGRRGRVQCALPPWQQSAAALRLCAPAAGGGSALQRRVPAHGRDRALRGDGVKPRV